MIPVRKAIPTIEKTLGSTVAVTDGGGNLVQTTGYYPSGTPYKLPSDAGTDMDAVADKLHIGNKWIGHKGFDLYDNTARMHDPLLARFHSVDPLFGNYPGSSPWTHCLANPLSYVDPDGRDVYVNMDLNLKNAITIGDGESVFIVISKSKNELDILDCIESNLIIPLPTEEEIALMSQIYEITETESKEAGYERFENDSSLKLVIGTEKSITFESRQKTGNNTDDTERLYTLHSHLPYKSNEIGYNACPSDEDIPQINQYKYPNIVLGYKSQLETLTTTRQERIVAFYNEYNKKGEIINKVNINFSTFSDKIKKIHKQIKQMQKK